MEKDYTNQKISLLPSEWSRLGRPLVRGMTSYTVSFSAASSLAQDAIESRRRAQEMDETDYPAGSRRNQVTAEKREIIATTSYVLHELAEFLPREVSVGDQAEAFLRDGPNT